MANDEYTRMTTLQYTSYGAGETDVVLVHGWAASHNMWTNVSSLFQQARLWAVDLPGYGGVTVAEGAPTMDEYSTMLIDFCQQTVRPKLIVAHSAGAMVTLQALAQQADLCDVLVLIAPVVTGRFGLWGMASDLLRHSWGVAVLRATKPLWGLTHSRTLLGWSLAPWHTNSQLARRVREDFIDTDPEAGVETLVSMAQCNMLADLPTIQQQTLVCLGKHDLTVPISEGQYAAEAMPHARLAWFEARHHPMDESPQEFAPIFSDFIHEHDIY